MFILIICTYFELCFSHEIGFQYIPPIRIYANNIQNGIQQAKQEETLDSNVYYKSDIVELNDDEKQVEQKMIFPLFDLLIISACIYAPFAFYFCCFKRGKKQQNQNAEIELNAIQKQKAQSDNHSQEEQIQFIESSCQQSDGTINRFPKKWVEKNTKQKNSIQSFKLSDDKIQNKEIQIDQIEDAQQVIDSINRDYNQEKHQDYILHEDKIQIDDQKPQRDKPPQQQFDNAQNLKEQYQSDLQQQHSNVEQIKQNEYNQFNQQIHKDVQQNIMQQEVQEQKVYNEKEQQNQIVENQQILICAYEILNEQLYIPSFKSRQIDDDELKKFVRSFKDVKQFQEEYNLDDSQEQLFLSEIKVFIPVRGDGNGLFTSIGLQYIFYNLIDDQRFERLLGLVQKTEFKQIYKQNIQQNGHQMEITVFQIEKDEEKQILRQQFENLIHKMKKSFHNQNEQNQLQVLADSINDSNGPFYGLLIIFLRNYFRQILQDFYDTNEMNYLIQNPDLINEINTWEHMYDETDIALKLFASKEQILIKCYQKMNVDDKTVDISEYKADDQQQFQYQIGLAFQPGHYNVLILKH